MGDGAVTETPERIWAWKWSIPSAMGQWSETDPRPYIGQDAARGCFEAVSADLYATTLARAERAEAELAKLADPNAVHVSMLAGTVAKPSWDQIKHIYAGESDKAEALLKEAVAELEGWVAIYENCSISTGYCCCGDPMGNHDNPMNCGHAPVDQGWHVSSQQIESTRASISRIQGDSHD